MKIKTSCAVMGNLNFLDRMALFQSLIDYLNTLCKVAYNTLHIFSFIKKIDPAKPIRGYKNIYLKIATFI